MNQVKPAMKNLGCLPLRRLLLLSGVTVALWETLGVVALRETLRETLRALLLYPLEVRRLRRLRVVRFRRLDFRGMVKNQFGK